MKNKFNKIIIASNNEHKISEIKDILEPYGFHVLSMKEAGINVEIEETGKTFEENAFIKAKTILDITGEASIADDSGLEVYALNGEPGVYSARYAGEHGNYKKNNIKLLEKMKDIKDEDRGARFVSAIVFLTPEGDKITAMGTVEGFIGHKERGENGFGYDPLFVIPSLGKTFAELSKDEKNAISHRGNALLNFKKEFYNKILNPNAKNFNE